jgi:hypothetical protein
MSINEHKAPVYLLSLLKERKKERKEREREREKAERDKERKKERKKVGLGDHYVSSVCQCSRDRSNLNFGTEQTDHIVYNKEMDFMHFVRNFVFYNVYFQIFHRQFKEFAFHLSVIAKLYLLYMLC